GNCRAQLPPWCDCRTSTLAALRPESLPPQLAKALAARSGPPRKQPLSQTPEPPLLARQQAAQSLPMLFLGFFQPVTKAIDRGLPIDDFTQSILNLVEALIKLLMHAGLD